MARYPLPPPAPVQTAHLPTTSPTRRANAFNPRTSPSTCFRPSTPSYAKRSATKKNATASNAARPSKPGTPGWPLLAFLIPSLHLKPDRAADKSKVLANLVRQKSFKPEVQLHILIREQHERRWSHRSLRHVINPHPLIHRHRSLLKIN